MKFLKFLSLVCIIFWSSCRIEVDNFHLAKSEILDKDYLGAIIRINMHMDEKGPSDSAFALRGFCYQNIWKDSLAKADFKRAIAINPKNYQSKLSLARIHFLEDSVYKAQTLFQEVAANAGKSQKSDANIELGRIKYFDEDFPEALSFFSKAIESDSSNEMAWYYRALLRSRFFTPTGETGIIETQYPFLDFEKAKSDLNKAIALVPDFADAYFQRAMLHFNSFDDGAGMNDINQAIELAPNYIYYYIGRAHQHMLMKRYKQALNDLEFAIDRNPNDYSAFEERALLYKAMGKLELSIEDSLKAQSLKKQKEP